MKQMFKSKYLYIGLLIVLIFTICFLMKDNENIVVENKEIEYWEKSESSNDILKSLQEKNGTNHYQKDLFEKWLKTLSNKSNDSLPKVNITSKSKKIKYGKNVVYTLEQEGYDKLVLYLHGGAYVKSVGSSHVKISDRLVNKINAKVYIPLYPLPKKYTYEDTFKLLDELYDDMLLEGKEIIIMGDSAGGGLALSYTEYLKENNKEMPSNVVLFSPELDISMSNEEINDYISRDLTLDPYGIIEAGKLWAGDTDLKDYRVSPIYGDLIDLPDILIFVGTEEIFYPDVMKLYNNIINTNIKVIVGNGLWHDFSLYDIDEKEKTLEEIKSFINKELK